MKNTVFLIAIIVLFFSCKSDSAERMKKANQEIALTEKDFEKMVAEKGIAEGFWFYADSNAVIKRQNDTLIKGKENIRNYYSATFYKTASVKWNPDFIEVSENGDMGYTYGKYLWQSKDSTGMISESRGVFHTVWKKQANGSWKYVWD